MKIGNVELKNNILLAPMAGITDLPFRLLCKEKGAGLVYTEMISAKALFYNDEKTKLLLKTCKEEKPLAVQIFGHDLQAIEYATKYVQDIADIVDINMGCPAPKIVKNGDGSKLLLEPEKIKEIVETAVKSSIVPISVKMRIGYDENNINGKEIAKVIEEAGASAIEIHGRTTKEYYSGQANWDIIKEIKENAKIPIIGNGDIKDEKTAKQKLEDSKVDGIMIGRASIGNPWIFDEINEYLVNGKIKEKPSKEEKLDIILKHLEMEIDLKGERTGINEMRKHISAYTKNMQKSSEYRNIMNTLSTKEEVIESLKKYFKSI